MYRGTVLQKDSWTFWWNVFYENFSKPFDIHISVHKSRIAVTVWCVHGTLILEWSTRWHTLREDNEARNNLTWLAQHKLDTCWEEAVAMVWQCLLLRGTRTFLDDLFRANEASSQLKTMCGLFVKSLLQSVSSKTSKYSFMTSSVALS